MNKHGRLKENRCCDVNMPANHGVYCIDLQHHVDCDSLLEQAAGRSDEVILAIRVLPYLERNQVG